MREYDCQLSYVTHANEGEEVFCQGGLRNICKRQTQAYEKFPCSWGCRERFKLRVIGNNNHKGEITNERKRT